MTRLETVAPEVWCAEHDHYMYGLIHFRGRMTVVRLADGALWLHSVIPIDDALARELDALGPVKHIVAPNRLHHVHLAGAIERYPEAKVWAAPNLPEKRKDLAFTSTLTDERVRQWGPEFAMIHLRGNPWIEECVFLHRPSGSLLVTDLVFHVHEVNNRLTRWILGWAGAFGALAQSKMWRSTTKDRDALRESLQTMMGWDFERVIMAHGAIVDGDASARLREALWWGLGESPKASLRAA